MTIKKKNKKKNKKKVGGLAKIASLTTTSITSALTNYKKNKELNKIKEIKLKKIEEKNSIIKERKELKNWEERLNKLENKLEIHAGIPGPATLKTLVSYATSCGIGNSIRFLSKQALSITKLATTRAPDKLIADLADYKEFYNNSRLTKLHFYAFGGIKKTSEWLSLISNSALNIKDNNEFEPIEK